MVPGAAAGLWGLGMGPSAAAGPGGLGVGPRPGAWAWGPEVKHAGVGPWRRTAPERADWGAWEAKVRERRLRRTWM